MKNDLPGYELLAQAFHAEGVRANFTLMGDANMHWTVALSQLEGVETVHARHEHCACGMAIGYGYATGKVGVASVTLGPGFTQTMTALATAARGHIPLVLFAGDVPVNPENAKWYNQGLEHAPLALAVGAHHIAPHSAGRLLPSVREAFFIAQTERKPVVLSVPFDLQKQRRVLEDYVPSSKFLPNLPPIPADPRAVAQIVEKIRSATNPIFIAGRGAMYSGASDAIRELAEQAGALLSTTLPCRGLFDDDPYNLGIAGGFANPAARDAFSRADLVVTFGASITSYTSDGGSLFPHAFVIQVDSNPLGLKDGVRAADLYVRADAKEAAEAIHTALKEYATRDRRLRTAANAERIRDLSVDRRQFSIAPDTVDPRAIIEELDGIIPKDWEIVSGTGHCAYFHSQMKNRRPENYHVVREFGAIGNGISIAIGVAIAKGNDKVVLIDGDGSLLMHIQELETIRRQGIKLLICVLNDGAYGAEIHKLRSEGIDESSAVFGRADFAAIAKGFGLRGAEINSLGEAKALFDDYIEQDSSEVWNIQISDQVVAPLMQKLMSQGLR
ncbi:thiamine pyrophosphate-binding protein [Mesorhizobium sp. YR577]|uniref:thiamine pyrophosphate-binding protein n=1 Tax=Mesorhizobium sp. YR577 TaxID=1884373 RepID=UPI0008EECD61|nr:thiamine pyrophosphate-binding protein [Mesorhizobium sp. YR577]SFT47765.1 Acetolactate synthase large subunit [Mesorhizobium sp. YR577]